MIWGYDFFFTLKGSGSSVRGLMGSDVVLLEGLTSLCKESTRELRMPGLKRFSIF